jgi:ribonuclease HII
MADFSIERKVSQAAQLVAGVDEAGRGALAGPVVAAAVIFSKYDDDLLQINDSKKFTHKKRLELFDLIQKRALCFNIQFIDNKTIDDINILNASMLAMKNAIENLEHKPFISLIDGNRFVYDYINHNTIVKGDAKSVSIAAASILAKVARDNYMINIANKYHHFRFDKHKGYGTKEHVSCIENYGSCEIHRKLFIKKILQRINNEKDYSIF